MGRRSHRTNRAQQSALAWLVVIVLLVIAIAYYDIPGKIQDVFVFLVAALRALAVMAVWVVVLGTLVWLVVKLWPIIERAAARGTFARLARDATRPPSSLAQSVPSNDSFADSPIEEQLWNAMQAIERIPTPVRQYPFARNGNLVTVADFAFPKQKVAVYCDGYQFHSTRYQLSKDAWKRNYVQNLGWSVLTFRGSQIDRNALRCAEEILEHLETRSGSSNEAGGRGFLKDQGRAVVPRSGPPGSKP